MLDRVYFFRDGISPNDINYQTVDQVDGSLGTTEDSPYHGDYSIIPPIRVSQDGSLVLLGSGDVYDATDLTRLGSIPGGFTDGLWISQNATLVIHDVNGNTQLQRRDANGAVVEIADFAGAPLALLRAGADFTVVTNQNAPAFHDYAPSDDSDGDGVDNTIDAFPLDPAASADIDGDGYPDAWNPGMTEADSTSGLTVDAYPNDAACYLLEHGDGTTCDITSTMPDYVPASMAVDAGGILYLFSPENNRIYRRDTATGDHLNPFVIGRDVWLDTAMPTVMVYHQGHNRLYLSYDSGDINYIDLASGPDETRLATAPGVIGGMADVGNFLLVQDDTGAWNTHHIFDANGGLRTSVEWNRYSRVYAWNPTLNRVYFFRDQTSPNDLHYEDIDQSTGEIIASGETPYHGDYLFVPPIRVSQDDALVLLGGGDIFDAGTLTWLGTIPGGFVDAHWTAAGGIVTVTDNAGNAQVARRDANGRVVDGANFSGVPLALFPSTNGFIVVIDGGIPEIAEYVPSDDSDGDSVLNSDDAFPTDPAASVDTDNDGYPDAWNPGMTEVDSTTGLTLDAYPNDSACYLVGHGDGVTCDITATMPDYVPTSMAVDDGGILYLFSRDNGKIYRRDTATGDHLNPFVVGRDGWLDTATPTNMVYHRSHSRLYLSYDSGDINYIDLSGGPDEARLTTVPGLIRGMADVGSFLLVQDNSSSSTHHIIDSSGVIRASANSYYSRVYAWNPTLNRVYFFRDGISPNDLHYEDVDPATGQIVSSGETPYHGDYSILPPIRVSQDGANVLLGGGDIFDAGNLTWLGAIPGGFVDAHWTAAGGIVTVASSGGSAQVVRRDANGVILDGANFAGIPLAMFPSTNGFYVVLDNGIPEFVEYLPSDDSDNDGVLNLDDAFPTDPAASVDTDNDGYPDAWNPGMTEADSTTRLTLDAYPADAACFLPGHGDGVTCDVTATIPNYAPTSAAIDGAGTIYLFSPQNNRIFRWDSASEEHLNPFIIGITDWLGSETPTSMVHHASHNRLYLGYPNGKINYIDLAAGDADEVLFATLSMSVGGLADVGNFLLAQDATGAWESHHIYDVNGVRQASREWNHYSRVYSFNAALSRVYYFRDGTSPNDLMFEDIDQTTGQIIAFGETPYHGAYNIIPPIRTSDDGSQIVLGSGDLYNASDLTWIGSYPNIFTDGEWLSDGRLVTIRPDGADTVVEVLNATFGVDSSSVVPEPPIAARRHGSNVVVITSGARPEFTVLTP